jgi:hypothetical protein
LRFHPGGYLTLTRYSGQQKSLLVK